MDVNRFYGNIKSRFLTMVKDNRLASEPVRIVSAKTTELVHGEETMVRAYIGKKATGTIYSSIKINKTIKVIDAVNLSLDNDFNRTIFFVVLNAVCDLTGLIPDYYNVDTFHANKDLVESLKSYNKKKLLIVGYDEELVKILKDEFELRILDLDESLYRQIKNGKKIYSPEKEDRELFLNWCDFMLVSGSTVINATFTDYLIPGKVSMFYGTSAMAAAHITKLNHFVPSKALLLHEKSESLQDENCMSIKLEMNDNEEIIKINQQIFSDVKKIADKQKQSVSEIVNHLLYNFIRHNKLD